ncbi:MAG: fatty acid hydroxylase [Anaeromyxobacteraceae bacterium]
MPRPLARGARRRLPVNVTGAGRSELRSHLLAGIPGWYSPGLHLASPSLVALGVASVALHLLQDVTAWQLAFVPAFLVVGNVVEWHVHRGVLHRRVRFLETLYLRHTPMHHAVFVSEDLAIRDRRELRMVLLPALAFPGLVALMAPLAIALAALGQRNLGLLWIASAVLYLLAYEWLHLAYHLPPDSWVGRLPGIAFLRRHHQRHHAPHLMARWNFNVTVPLWDLVKGTVWRPHGAPVVPTRTPAPEASPAPRRG